MQKLDFLLKLLEDEDDGIITSVKDLDYGQLEIDIISMWEHLYDSNLTEGYVDIRVRGAVLAFKFGFYRFSITTENFNRFRLIVTEPSFDDRMHIEVIPNFSSLPRQLTIQMYTLLSKLRERKDMMLELNHLIKKSGLNVKATFKNGYREIVLKNLDLDVGPNGEYGHWPKAEVYISSVLENFGPLKYNITIIDENGNDGDEFSAATAEEVIKILRENDL